MAANITIANILKAGLQAAYNQLETKDANTLYFCTDTGKMYKGEVDFTESVKVVATKPDNVTFFPKSLIVSSPQLFVLYIFAFIFISSLN